MKKENIKKYEYVRNGIRICLKKKSENKENMENNTEKMFLKKTRKREEFIREYINNPSKNVLKNKKDKNELKSAEVDSVNSFIEDKVQSSSDAEVFTEDDADTEKDRIIRFRWNVCDWQQNINDV